MNMQSLLIHHRAFELLLLYVVAFMTRLGFGAIVVAFPHYVVADSFTTGVVLAVYPLFEAATAAPVGMYVDRRGRKRMLLFGLLSISVLTFLVGLSRETLYIAVVHGVMGVAAAAVIVSTLTMITDYTRRSDRGLGMGAFDLANIAGYAGGIIIGTSLYTVFEAEPSYVFFSITAMLLIPTVVAKVFLAEPPHEPLQRPQSLNFLKELSWKIKAVLPLWFALTTLVGIAFFIPKALSVEGFSIQSTGLLLFLGASGLGIGAIIFGRISDKIGREKTMWIGVVGMATLLPSLALWVSSDTDIYSLTFGPYIYLIVPSALLTSALVPSILALVGDTARINLRGSAMGLYSVMLSIGIAIGNIVGGISGQIGGLATVLYVAEALFLAAVLATIILIRLKKEEYNSGKD